MIGMPLESVAVLVAAELGLSVLLKGTVVLTLAGTGKSMRISAGVVGSVPLI